MRNMFDQSQSSLSHRSHTGPSSALIGAEEDPRGHQEPPGATMGRQLLVRPCGEAFPQNIPSGSTAGCGGGVGWVGGGLGGGDAEKYQKFCGWCGAEGAGGAGGAG